MAQDVTHIIEILHSRKILLSITFEHLMLILCPLFLIPAAYFCYNDVRRRRRSTTVPSGCTKLGLQNVSNNADEFDEKYDTGTADATKWRVKTIYVHPIKSCAPIELAIADVDAEGLTYDRKFAFAELLKPLSIKADASDEDKMPRWTFRTLRQPGYEKLALVKPEIWIPTSTNAQDSGRLGCVEQEGALIVKYPNEPTGTLAALDRLMLKWGLLPKESSFRVPFHPGKNHKYPLERVNIWVDNPTWLNMGEHVPNDFKEWLGIKNPFTIFRADPDSYRNIFRCAPRKEEIGYQPAIGFQDAYPLNLMNIASVHDVSKKVGSTINGLSVRRFRTNIVLEGPPAYDEDDWKYVKIGENEYYCACHTVRCRVSISMLLEYELILSVAQRRS